MKYKKKSSVTKHPSGFQDVVNSLVAMKMMLDDELQVLLLLNSLYDS